MEHPLIPLGRPISVRLWHLLAVLVPQHAAMELVYALPLRNQRQVRDCARHRRAGGIGQSLYENIRSFQYSETAAIIIIIVLTVSLIDLLSAQVRKLLV